MVKALTTQKGTVFGFALLWLLTSTAAAQLANTAAPKFGVDKFNTGFSPFQGPLSSYTAWRTYATGYRLVSIGDADTLYVVCADDNLHCLNAIDGSERWTEFPGAHRFGPYPTVAVDGTVYVVSRSEREVIAVREDAVGPYVKWVYTHPTDELLQFAGIAVADNGAVLIARDGLFAIDPADGSPLWTYSGRKGDWTGGCPAIADVDQDGLDDTVYVGLSKTGLNAVDLLTGRKVWTAGVGGITGAPAVDPVTGVVYVVNKKLSAVSAAGEVLWQVALGPKRKNPGGGSTAPAIDYLSGTVIAIGADGLYAINAETGALRWRFDAVSLGTYTKYWNQQPRIGLDGTVYWKNSREFYAISANGELLWQYFWPGVGADPPSSPVIDADGKLYLCTDQDGLIAYQDME